jgi:hypothetical protein
MSILVGLEYLGIVYAKIGLYSFLPDFSNFKKQKKE